MPTPNPLVRGTDPNAQCTCGWRRFRVVKEETAQPVLRYVFFQDGDGEGFGSVPFGMSFGSGRTGLWAEFEGTLRSCTSRAVCERCGRLRYQRILSTSVIYGAYEQGNSFYVVGADIRNAGCFVAEFRNSTDDTVVTSSLAPVSVVNTPLALGNLIPQSSPVETPPIGAALADTLLEVPYPQVPVSGTYAFVLVNRCCSFELTLGIVQL